MWGGTLIPILYLRVASDPANGRPFLGPVDIIFTWHGKCYIFPLMLIGSGQCQLQKLRLFLPPSFDRWIPSPSPSPSPSSFTGIWHLNSSRPRLRFHYLLSTSDRWNWICGYYDEQNLLYIRPAVNCRIVVYYEYKKDDMMMWRRHGDARTSLRCGDDMMMRRTT